MIKSPFSVPNPRSILPEPTGGGPADTWDDAGMRVCWMSCGSCGMLCSHMTRNGSCWLGSLGYFSFRFDLHDRNDIYADFGPQTLNILALEPQPNLFLGFPFTSAINRTCVSEVSYIIDLGDVFYRPTWTVLTLEHSHRRVDLC